jgi:hypothetical protein
LLDHDDADVVVLAIQMPVEEGLKHDRGAPRAVPAATDLGLLLPPKPRKRAP